MAEVGAEVGTAAATVTATGRRLRAPLPWPAWRGLVAWLEAERPQWFNWLPVALGCGIAVYFALPSEPSLAAAIAPLPVALLLWLLVRRGSIAAALLGVLVAACLGLALAKLRSDSIAAPVLERRMGPVEVRGFVELVEPRETRGERLTIRVTSIDGVNRDRTPSRVRIRTMNSPAEGVTLKPGDAVRVKAHLAPPSGPVLPGGYDFARGAYFQGLGGIGYALSRAALDREAGSAPDGLALPAAIARLRHDISARVTAALPGQTGAIATALISGERGAISTVTNDAYRDSGLYHVLSISGLHMAIMGGAVFYAVRIALALFPAIALRYPVKKWAAATAILASLGYLAISGAAFATVRSAVTITIMFLAVLLDRPAIAMRNVALSALLILLVWPESLNDVGFQMSFSAVVALVASYESLRRRLLRRAQWPEGAMAKAALFVGGIVLSTFIASVAVAPFGAYYFHKGQQLAIVANVIATPVINLVIMPAALGALILMPLGLEGLPLALMGLGIDATTRTAEWVAALPGATSRIAAISPASFVTMAVGGLWLLLWRERPRWLGLAVIAAGLALAPLTERPDILVGHDGQLVAARGRGGLLAALAAPQTRFELSRWLEHDGDARAPKDAVAAPGFHCDHAGCVARVRGLTVAYPRHPSAIADDCARADIVLLTVPRPKGCTRPRAVIDFFALRAQGTHAIYISAGADPRPAAGIEPSSIARSALRSNSETTSAPAAAKVAPPGAGAHRSKATDPTAGATPLTKPGPGEFQSSRLDAGRGPVPTVASGPGQGSGAPANPGPAGGAVGRAGVGATAGKFPGTDPGTGPGSAPGSDPGGVPGTGPGLGPGPSTRSSSGKNIANSPAAVGTPLAPHLPTSPAEALSRAPTAPELARGEPEPIDQAPSLPPSSHERTAAQDGNVAPDRAVEPPALLSASGNAIATQARTVARMPGQSSIRIVTVSSARGDRPWSRLPWWAAPRDRVRDGEPTISGGDRQRTGGGDRSGDIDRSGSGSRARPSAGPRPKSRLWAFAASPEFLASQQIPHADAEIEDALRDPSLYDERW